MKIIERLRQFIEFKGVTLDNFNKKIGAGKGYIEKQIQRNASIGSDRIETIVSIFPDLNVEWLITGEGEMLKSDQDQKEAPPDAAIYQLRDENYKLKDEIIRLQNEVIKLQKEGVTIKSTTIKTPYRGPAKLEDQ